MSSSADHKNICGSVVVFQPNLELLGQTICSFFRATNGATLGVWDNSPTRSVEYFLNEKFPGQIQYYFSGANLGYGSGHNRVFQKLGHQYKYFCVLNPDINIPAEAISTLSAALDKNPEYGLISSSIKGPDEKPHFVHKYVPSFIDYFRIILGRKFPSLAPKFDRRDFSFATAPYKIPVMSGCFMMFRSSHYAELRGFDERFFLYFEDYDLSLRSFLARKSVVLPSVTIYHHWARSSHKRLKLLLVHLKSGFKFYFKWGFGQSFFDEENSLAGDVSLKS
jgi:GT2 family glycosyltransferase